MPGDSTTDFIFIHGAPGTGKSSLAWALQARFQSPCFEFGWIPEFRTRRNSTISYVEEEGLAFDNLCLVLRNYARHGFDRIIVTDLRDPIIRQLPRRFSRYRYLLFTLWVEDENELKARVLNQARSSGYRDWKEALDLNRTIRARKLMTHEVRLDSSRLSVEELADEVVKYVGLPDKVENG